MNTVELVKELRSKAKLFEGGNLWLLLNTAADRLEELDERVAIMEDGCK